MTSAISTGELSHGPPIPLDSNARISPPNHDAALSDQPFRRNVARMPVTAFDFPILARFLCVVHSTTGMPVPPLSSEPEAATRGEDTAATLSKGVVLGPDGKPCKTCTSGAQWKAMMRGASTPRTAAAPPAVSASSTSTARNDCPADVEELGRATWTFLHTWTANYPERPSLQHQSDTRSFLQLFGKMYPCWVCADDFRAYMSEPDKAPRVSDRDEFGRWMCEAHNAVNTKLGKPVFDCNKWEERWRTGWKDGRCD